MSTKKILSIIIWGILLLGIIFGIIDYNKLKNGEMPIFVVAEHDKSGPEINYYGLGYKVVRNPGVSYKEKIYMDNYVKFGSWFYTWKIKINKPVIDYIRGIETVEANNCDKKAKLYTNLGDKKIYTYCLDNIVIKESNQGQELSNYLKNNPNVIDEIIRTITYIDVAFDGGTKLYKDNGTSGYTNNGLTIIKCHSMVSIGNYNEDIYIGPESMNYKSDFCKNDIKEFVRTYQVLEIKENDQQGNKTYNVTLRQFQAETETVLIPNLLEDFDVKENEIYEFKFERNNNSTEIEDNIKSIFENSEVISITKTDKIGLDQIQDPIK